VIPVGVIFQNERLRNFLLFISPNKIFLKNEFHGKNNITVSRKVVFRVSYIFEKKDEEK